MCKELKVRKLPKGTKIRRAFTAWDSGGLDYNRPALDEARQHREYVMEDAPLDYSVETISKAKLQMLSYVHKVLKAEGMEFDEFNGLAPTRLNLYRGYEFSAVWIWTEIAWFIQHSDDGIEDAWYGRNKAVLASVMRKYPKITGMLITIADLKIPGNKLLDYSKMENADFDGDHTDEVLADDKADEFKTWILKWCDQATEKDKMRVRNWFHTKKSHKQIFAEIQKVVGNYYKFNARLALFVEGLFNKENLDYFFSKSGFDSKEELFMAYFDKLTDFDEETKKAFIKKFLV